MFRRCLLNFYPKRRLGHGIIPFAVTFLLVSGCAGSPVPIQISPTAEVTPTPVSLGHPEDTLRILHPEASTILNPHLTGSVKDWEPSRLTYEPLATFNKDGELVPILATEIPTIENGGVASDGKSVTWKLRQDVKWSDGEFFTADDVLFTYQFVSNPAVNASSQAIYDTVESVEVIDDHTIKVNFKDVNPAWALPFVGFQGVIIPRHIFEPYNGPDARAAPANTLPVGTGPYRVIAPGIKPQEVLLLGSKIVETNKIVFEPNPYFREEGKPYFSQVEWKGGGVVSEAARLVLQEGEVDYAYSLWQLAPEELEALAQAGAGSLVTNFGSKVNRILINRTDPNRETADGERSSLEIPHPFFGDDRVRQAIAHAIDREAIAAVYGPLGRPTDKNLVAPPQYVSPNSFYEFDLEKAKSLLAETGWLDTDGDAIRDKDGQKLSVVLQSPSINPQEARDIIQAALESIGVEVILKIVDPSDMFGACSVDNPDADTCFNADMQEFALRSVSPDPSAYMQFWTCAQIPQKDNNWSGWNDERWCNPAYDQLHEQSTTELDPEKRRQLFIQMNDMLIEDVVMIPVVYLADAQGVGDDIEGIDLTPWDTNTWNIKDWRRASP